MNISLLQEDLFGLQIAWVGRLQELRKVHTLIRLVEVVPVETIKVILRDGFLEGILHGMQVVPLNVQFGVLCVWSIKNKYLLLLAPFWVGLQEHGRLTHR